MTLWAIAGRRKLAQVREQQLVAWESLYGLVRRSISKRTLLHGRDTIESRTFINKSLTVNAFRRFASRLCTGLIAYARVSIALSYCGLTKLVNIRHGQFCQLYLPCRNRLLHVLDIHSHHLVTTAKVLILDEQSDSLAKDSRYLRHDPWIAQQLRTTVFVR